jgi:hypothetical protein
MLDLVEIKLSTIQVMDREDAREAAILEACKRELSGLLHKPKSSNGNAGETARPASL